MDSIPAFIWRKYSPLGRRFYPLSPKIHIQILQTGLYTFQKRISKENKKINAFFLSWLFNQFSQPILLIVYDIV